jgi:hypothetical protein
MKKSAILAKYVVPVILCAVVAALPAQSAFAANPKNCLEILQTTGGGDGDYVIEPVNGRIFSVYCKDMSSFSHAPKEYITLANTSGDYNFSQFTAGGWVTGTSVRTNYTKLRIDPYSLMVDIGDTAFSTTTGQLCSGGGACASAPISYSTALDCSASDSQTGAANVDLTGTPFIVSSEFYANGWNTAGTVKFGGRSVSLQTNLNGPLVTGKVVNLTGGGYCGGTGPRGYNSFFDSWNGATSGLALHLQYVGQ